MNRILLLIIFSVMLGSINAVFANQPQDHSKRNVLNYEQYLRTTPRLVIKIHGPLKYNSQPKFPFLPGDPNLFMGLRNFSGEALVNEYVSASEKIWPTAGFQIAKLDSSVIKELQESCRKDANSKTSYAGKEVFVFEDRSSEYWDFTTNSKSDKLFYCFLDSNTVMATTSLGYFKPNSNRAKAVSVKVGTGGKFSFFDTVSSTTSKSICVERLFGADDAFFRKEIPVRIEAIHFDRTGDLLQGPFKFVVFTRKDSLSDARLLFNEFHDLKDEKKSLKRLEACKYELTIDSDSGFFYSSLLSLFFTGIPGI